MSILMLYLVTIATHRLAFFSSNYGVNEEQTQNRLEKQTNKQTNKLTNKNG